jgi:hypothetical protein
MLSCEKADTLFNSVHYFERANADWRDASEENFAATYNFIANVWSNFDEMIDDSETVGAKVKKAFPYDDNAKYFRCLGKFKDIDYSSSRKDIYNSWVRKLERVRQDGIQPDLSILRIFVSQARKLSRQLLPEQLSDKTIVDTISALMFNMTGGIYYELKIIEEMVAKYSNHPTLRFRPASSNLEGAGIDAIIYNFKLCENVHYISIKCFGAMKDSALRKHIKKQAKKNEDHFKRTGKRRPEVNLFMGITEEGGPIKVRFASQLR